MKNGEIKITIFRRLVYKKKEEETVIFYEHSYNCWSEKSEEKNSEVKKVMPGYQIGK